MLYLPDGITQFQLALLYLRDVSKYQLGPLYLREVIMTCHHVMYSVVVFEQDTFILA